mmetsp:Transcript_94286/g.149067  ORF Transcript_94286/g.149067 Transcript_94286/m.149067 type:complete len:205 (+) Transcript_94286:159-773(+)
MFITHRRPRRANQKITKRYLSVYKHRQTACSDVASTAHHTKSISEEVRIDTGMLSKASCLRKHNISLQSSRAIKLYCNACSILGPSVAELRLGQFAHTFQRRVALRECCYGTCLRKLCERMSSNTDHTIFTCVNIQNNYVRENKQCPIMFFRSLDKLTPPFKVSGFVNAKVRLLHQLYLAMIRCEFVFRHRLSWMERSKCAFDW